MNEVKEENEKPADSILISQSVAILVDGNNIERSIHSESHDSSTMLNFDGLIPKLLVNRGLSRLVYFREGKHISSKLQERLHNYYHGSVRPCHKSADIPLSIFAVQVANKVDTIIIMSGDADYIELVRHLKSEGVRVEIAAVANTTSKLMIEEADYFHEITSEHWFTLPGKKPQKRKKN
ncbi:MAG: NYN domain-containing protein [Gammaproteobacteria bacterium]